MCSKTFSPMVLTRRRKVGRECFTTPGFFVLQEELHPQVRPFAFLFQCVAGASFPIHTLLLNLAISMPDR